MCGLEGREIKLLTCHIPKSLLYSVVRLVGRGKEGKRIQRKVNPFLETIVKLLEWEGPGP